MVKTAKIRCQKARRLGYNCTHISSSHMDGTPRADGPLQTFSEDYVFRLLRRVAQRADELARVCPTGGSAKRDRETWQRAESEFLPALGAAHFGGQPAHDDASNV
jgi:hypothetical protein